MQGDPDVERRLLESKLRLKYALDRVLALVVLPFVLVVGVVAAVAMAAEAMLDPASAGPLLYVEERWSQGRPFKIMKFRTTLTATQAPGEAGVSTRVGAMLKKWYLDELPQVVNVLRGEMTFVGPRPNVPWKARHEIENEGMRSKLILRAGLTGLVQVYKREARDRDRYRCLEDAYLDEVRGRTPWSVVVYDVELMARTVPFMLRGEGL